jgi:hypothetical protein
MFVRFVATARDKDSQRRVGVFHAAQALHKEGRLTDAEREWYGRIRRWFERHLLERHGVATAFLRTSRRAKAGRTAGKEKSCCSSVGVACPGGRAGI